jgi:ADP-heptose:LPS heptosyltransferase
MAHATNAFGTPAVVLFGPSAPVVWSHANVVAISRHLRCAPCIDLLGGIPCPYQAPCMSRITVDEVARALRQALARPPAAHAAGARIEASGARV